MLVITRRKGDWVRIGDDIFIIVLDIQEDHVRLGFDAPRHVHISRVSGNNDTRSTPMTSSQKDYISSRERLTFHQSWLQRIRDFLKRRKHIKACAAQFIGIIH